MYEIRSCGVVLDICKDTYTASHVYDNSTGAHVELFKYNERGQKYRIKQRFNHLKVASSKQSKPK